MLYRVHVALADFDLTAAAGSLASMVAISLEHGIDDVENFRYEGRIRALEDRMPDAARAYSLFFAREAARCRAMSGDQKANAERLSWAPAHLEEQVDELVRWRGVASATEFLGCLQSALDVAALADIYPDLGPRIHALMMGARNGHEASNALRNAHVSRAPATSARWAFNLYAVDLEQRRAGKERDGAASIDGRPD
jgi:hypothetical protein